MCIADPSWNYEEGYYPVEQQGTKYIYFGSIRGVFFANDGVYSASAYRPQPTGDRS